MAPAHILIIRHAEEHNIPDMTAEGDHDAQSLTVRGWQRAGALVRLFYPGERGPLTPAALFTSAVAPGSSSLRPRQTIAPLHARLREAGPVGYDDAFAKHYTLPLMEAVTCCPTILGECDRVSLSWTAHRSHREVENDQGRESHRQDVIIDLIRFGAFAVQARRDE